MLFAKQNPEKKYHGFHKNVKQHKIFNIDNNKNISLAANQHIQIISEGTWHWRLE